MEAFMRFFGRQGWERTLLLMAMVVIGVVCVSYGQTKPPALVGQWIFADGYKSSKVPNKIELFSDGTGVMDDRSLTWKVENKRLMLLTSSVGIAADYKVSGYELVLTYDDMSSTAFVKKGMLEEYRKKKNEQAKKDAEQRFGKISTYFTDPRDGQKYRAVNIGGKTWMAENLNYKTGNSKCYDNDNSNCYKYGRLYDWNTAKTACPIGWKLPSQYEWNNLVMAAGGNAAGKALKSTSGWGGYNAVDAYGFSAMPGGGSVFNEKETGLWWTATEVYGSDAFFRSMGYFNDRVGEANLGKEADLSVRCIQDEKKKDEERLKKEAEQRNEKISTYFTDSRDGQKYRAVKIGEKTWMAQNLNYQTGKSWCYDNKNSNCDKYGHLYDWETATTVCPNGWHLPSRDEWGALAVAVGGKGNYGDEGIAGKMLKSTSGWDNNGNGFDGNGFSALPGGRRYTDGSFIDGFTDAGFWWTATENGNGNAYYRHMGCGYDGMLDHYNDKGDGFSVRCVADN